MKIFPLILSISLFAYNILSATEYKVIAKVDRVTQPGYYKILLLPDVISYSSMDYGDIRLFNSKNNEIPYIFREEEPASAISGFKEYPLLENKYYGTRKYTRVVIHNIRKDVLSELNVIIRNSDTEKEITLKGSDNQTDWFIIRRGWFDSSESFDETSQRMEFTFPKSNYEYLELTINDKKKDPVQVMAVGYYDTQLINGLYTAVPVKEIRKVDSADHRSYVTLRFGKEYEISRLIVNVTEPELYHRNCSLGNYVSHKQKKVFQESGYYELSSTDHSPWEINKTRTKELVIVIENSDNVPFTAVKVKAFQLNKYLIAKLEPGETYEVRTGNNKLTLPDYDLKYFTDSIPANLVLLHTSEVKATGLETSGVSKTFFTKTVLWVVIVLVIGLLGFLSVRMMKDMSKEKS
jgi:hypothetical protein